MRSVDELLEVFDRLEFKEEDEWAKFLIRGIIENYPLYNVLP